MNIFSSFRVRNYASHVYKSKTIILTYFVYLEVDNMTSFLIAIKNKKTFLYFKAYGTISGFMCFCNPTNF